MFYIHRPKGFIGTHGYKLESCSSSSCRLTHLLEMNTTGLAILTWPLVYRPLHDALIEDSLTRAEQFAQVPDLSPRNWSLWVKCLRSLVKRPSKRKNDIQPAQSQEKPTAGKF